MMHRKQEVCFSLSIIARAQKYRIVLTFTFYHYVDSSILVMKSHSSLILKIKKVQLTRAFAMLCETVMARPTLPPRPVCLHVLLNDIISHTGGKLYLPPSL